MTTAQIARAFLVQETTMAQRITRAKRKITDAGDSIPDPSFGVLPALGFGVAGDYRSLQMLHLAPSPVTRLHRTIALRYLSGPQAAMTELDILEGELERYHLYHATRADLQRELGRLDDARAADRRALELTANPAERAVLQERIACTYPEETHER